MLSDATKQKMDEAIAAIAAEDHTVCAVAIGNKEESFQPFSNLQTTAEFVYNMLSAAGMVAESIGADVSAIEAAQQKFTQQFIKIHEA
jgi:hypothetical protein